jgi:hypothetical protein
MQKGSERCWVNFKFTVVWTSLLLGKLEVYAILDWLLIKLNLFYLILSPTLMKTHYSIFAVAQIRFWNVQSIFISHYFHVRKKYDLHHPKPDLATSDGTTTTINTCFFIKYFLFTK